MLGSFLQRVLGSDSDLRDTRSIALWETLQPWSSCSVYDRRREQQIGFIPSQILGESCQIRAGGLELADAHLAAFSTQNQGDILPKTQEQHPIFSIWLPQKAHNSKV